MVQAVRVGAVLATIVAARIAAADPRPAAADPRPVAADPRPAAGEGEGEARPAVSTKRRTLAIIAAIVPGIVARGIGSELVHERRAAKRLGAISGIGIVAMAVGGVPILISGGNKYTLFPGLPLFVAGTGLFLTSWLSDIYVAAGGSRAGGVPRARVPWLVEAGPIWLQDAYHDRALIHAAGRFVIGRVDLGAGGYLDVRNNAREGYVDAYVRIIGAAETGAVVADGSRLMVRAAVRARDDDDDRVSAVTGEAELIARLDMQRVDRALAGAFIELSTGAGIERASFSRDQHNNNWLFLGRFAWGMYIGRRGEASVFYDHRRDQLAGGLVAPRSTGFVGNVGLGADLRIIGRWAVRAELEFGNARVATLALRYQGGPP
jgi:hypothetical protein